MRVFQEKGAALRPPLMLVALILSFEASLAFENWKLKNGSTPRP
jgi:hypothetical protein